KQSKPFRDVLDMLVVAPDPVEVVQDDPAGFAEGFRTRFLPSTTSSGRPTCPTNHVSSKIPGSAGVGGRSEYVTLFLPFAESCTASIAPSMSTSFTSTVPASPSRDRFSARDTERATTVHSPDAVAATDVEAPVTSLIVAVSCSLFGPTATTSRCDQS